MAGAVREAGKRIFYVFTDVIRTAAGYKTGSESSKFERVLEPFVVGKMHKETVKKLLNLPQKSFFTIPFDILGKAVSAHGYKKIMELKGKSAKELAKIPGFTGALICNYVAEAADLVLGEYLSPEGGEYIPENWRGNTISRLKKTARGTSKAAFKTLCLARLVEMDGRQIVIPIAGHFIDGLLN